MKNFVRYWRSIVFGCFAIIAGSNVFAAGPLVKFTIDSLTPETETAGTVVLHVYSGMPSVTVSFEGGPGVTVSTLPAEVFGEAILSVPIDVAPGGVRSLSVWANDENANRVATDTFYFVSDSSLRYLTAQDAGARVQAEAAARYRAAAEERARTHFRSAINRGYRPALIAEPATIDEQAWNDVVTSSDVLGNAQAPDGACGVFTLSLDNYRYDVTGTVKYKDPQSLLVVPLAETGYRVSIRTEAEYVDDCGNIEYRDMPRTATTGTGGTFTISGIYTTVAGGSGNPVTRFGTTTADVGTWVSNTTNITVSEMYLTSDTDMNFVWQNGSAVLTPTYTNLNHPSDYFYFRWEDEIKSLQRRWSAAGFGSSYTPFKAGYDAGGTIGFFQSGGQGVVVMGSAAWVKFLMAHEFGHHFQLELQTGAQLGSGPLSHSACVSQPVESAFFEGFADWHGAYWESDGRANYVRYASGEIYPCTQTGQDYENNVAAFFWDVFDSNNSATYDNSVDTVQYSLSLLKSWAAREYLSFSDFYSDFATRNLWSPNQSITDQLRTINHVP